VIGRVATIVCALSFALLASACGRAEPDSSEEFRGEAKLVANTIEDLQTAGKRGDGARICRDLLAASVVRAIRQAGSKSCAARLEDSLEDADTFELTVKSVNVKGRTATATVASDDGNEKDRLDTMTLAKEGKRWKITALGG
jgi:hypothetical protein